MDLLVGVLIKETKRQSGTWITRQTGPTATITFNKTTRETQKLYIHKLNKITQHTWGRPLRGNETENYKRTTKLEQEMGNKSPDQTYI